MTKNERIKRLEKAVYELVTLLGYTFDFSKEYLIPKPMTWRPTFIEISRVLQKELGIEYVDVTQPKARVITVTKEKKNVRKTKKQTKSG